MASLARGRIAIQVVSIEDRAHVVERVSGQRGDLCIRNSCECQATHGGAAKVVERHPETPQTLQAFRQDERKPSLVQGRPSELSRI